MNIGILQICDGECFSDDNRVDLNRVSYLLAKHGYFSVAALSVCASNTAASYAYLKTVAQAVLICGKVEEFYSAVGGNGLETFLLGETPCAVSRDCPESFITNTLIPMLNGSCKTFYTSAVFCTAGKTEEQLRSALKDYIKNRNKISFKFDYCNQLCKITVRYSNKTQKNTVSDMLKGVSAALKDCLYATKETELSQAVAELLMQNGKTLGLAESFTGGNIASALVNIPGISASLKEGIVCYDNSVKINRLRVSPLVISNQGAVSVETAYEMAANLLISGNYDYVVATTGNAGPTSERPNEVGVCYIAVGDKNNIDIFPHRFSGDRKQIIKSGTNIALYHLYSCILKNLS